MISIRFAVTCAFILRVSALAGQDHRTPIAIVGADSATRLDGPVALAALPASFVVLQNSAPFLRVFNGQWKEIQSIGDFGTKPGNYRAPGGVAYDARQHRVLVGDPANGRVNIYALAHDTLHFLRASKVIDASLTAICVMNGRLYGLGFHAGMIVQEMLEADSTFEVARSLGKPEIVHPLADNDMIRHQVAFGTIVCDPAQHEVITASFPFGDLQFIPVDGRPQRSVMIQSFHPVNIVSQGKSLNFSMPSSGVFNETAGVLLGKTDLHVYYGVAEGTHRGGGDYSTLQEVQVRAGDQQKALGRLQSRPIWLGGDRIACLSGARKQTIAVFAGASCP